MATSRKGRSLEDLEAPASLQKPAKKTAKKSAKKASTKTAKKEPRVVVPSAEDYLKELRAMKGVDEEDFAFMGDPIAWTSNVNEWIPTGCLAIDRLIGGGWPVGRIVEVAAWENVGKSTLLDQSIGMAQGLGHITALMDTEQGRDEKYSRALGVDPGKLILGKAETIEEAFEGFDRILAIQEAHIQKLAKVGKKPPAMLLVWDSLAGTPTKAERDGAADDKHVAEAAKRVKLNLRRLTQRIAHARVCLVFTNQFYQDIGPFASIKTFGGGAVRYYTSLRLWLTKKESLKVGNDVVGHIIQAKIKKTRVSAPRPPEDIGLIYGAGIHNAYTLFEWGKNRGVGDAHKWVQQAGGWSYLMRPDGTHAAFQRSFIGFAEQLRQEPAIYQQMAAQYMAEAA